MAQFLFKISILCINFLVIYSTAYDEIVKNGTQCSEKCTKSFAPHTYPNGAENDACVRGCRFYTLREVTKKTEQLIEIVDKGLSPTKHFCYTDCVEAYNETSADTAACKVGCDAAEVISVANKAEKDKVEAEGSVVHTMIPIMQIKEIASKVVGMLRIVQTSITTYFLRDDEQIVSREGPVEIMIQVIPNARPNEDSSQRNEEQKHESNSIFDSLESSSSKSNVTSVSVRESSLGIPPYLLIISTVSFIIFLAYLLFFVCSSKSLKQRQLESGMPIPSHALPVKLVRPEDLTKLSLMDEEEGSLPGLSNKLKLPDNTRI